MKYKVGDVVKLRDDLEENKDYGYINAGMINQIKSEPFLIAEVQHDKYINSMGWVANDEMIEGLWDECKGITYEPYEEEPKTKLKLIDVLNMIAKGELKEGTKVKWQKMKYIFEDGELEREGNEETVNIFEDMYCINLNDEEVELIEPPCEHEWLNWETHGIGEGIIRRFRRCVKCGLEEVTEKCVPDVGNTIELSKIEELKYDDFWEWDAYSAGEDEEEFIGTEAAIKMIFNKLNEVIRKINKE